MKRIYLLLLACMGAMSVMAQGQKLKNRVIDKDYYPVDSAKVIVKGTNISTFTDKNGEFALEDVPLILDSIEIQKRNKSYSAEIPVRIRMRKAVMDRFSWFVRAGWEFPLYDFEGMSACQGSYMFSMGAGVDLKVSRHVSFQPSANLSIRKMKGYDYEYLDGRNYDGDIKLDMGVLEVPLLFAFKIPVGMSANIVLRAGGYFDIGLWGTGKIMNNRYDDSRYEFDLYGKRFSGGAAYGLGFEKGHYMFSLIGKTGWISQKQNVGYTSFGLEIGYKF